MSYHVTPGDTGGGRIVALGEWILEVAPIMCVVWHLVPLGTARR